MKLFKLLVPASITLFVSILASAPLSSCKKTKTIVDTLIVTKHDTTVVIDSIYDITSGMVAYYNFNNGSLKDSSGYGNHIVFNNATATTDRFGNANNAYLFNGNGSYMRVTNSASLNPNNITLHAIIKINGFYSSNCHVNQILGKGTPDNVNGIYTMRFSDFTVNCSDPIDSAHEKFAAGIGDNIPQGSSAGATADTVYAKKGTWYTLTYTYDGITSKFYINGVLKASNTKTAPSSGNSYDLTIGRHNDATYPYWFNGVIDEVRIYNRALPQGAITQLNKLKN